MVVTIADKGVAKAVVVVGGGADEAERHAAGELVYFLGRITGAEFKIVNQAGGGESRLLVGVKAGRLAEGDFSVDGLGAEGMVIRTVGDDLILAGGRPRGTLYAVYSFLEEQLGCRWWSSKVSSIPKTPDLKIESLDIRYVPPLEYRELWWYDAFDGDWSVRNKCNGHRHQWDSRRGGGHRFEGYVHTFYKLLPPEKYFAEHPEWYSEIDGRRTIGDNRTGQLCLTNEQARRELVKILRERLRANPEATIASVSQRDWLEHGCQCEKCLAVDAEEGSPAGTLLRFVNAVAADIEEEFPQVSISTLAYTFTRKPPRITRPRHNVIMRLCTFECSFSKPLTDPCNRKFYDDIVGWSKICERLYIWDYTTNFDHYVMCHPNLRVLAANVKFFVEHNVKGIMEQGAYQAGGAEMAELRAWVLAKLLWDPTLDGEKLIEEFVHGYYGSAAEYVLAYLKVMHDAVEASGDKLGLYSPVDAKFLSFDTLSRGWAHLKGAEAAVDEDGDLRHRVRHGQLGIMYVFIRRWDELRQKAKAGGAAWPMPESIEKTFEEFRRIAQAHKLTRLNEWQEGYGVLEEAVKKAKSQEIYDRRD